MRKTLMTILALLPLLVVSATANADDEPKLEGYELAEKYYREIIDRAMEPKRQARVEEDNRELWELIKRLFDKYPAPAVPDVPDEPKGEVKEDIGPVPEPKESLDANNESNSTPTADDTDVPPENTVRKAVIQDKAVVPAVATEAADDASGESLAPLKTEATPDDKDDKIDVPTTAPCGDQMEEIGTAIRQVRSRLEDLAAELNQLEAEIEALSTGITESTVR